MSAAVRVKVDCLRLLSAGWGNIASILSLIACSKGEVHTLCEGVRV